MVQWLAAHPAGGLLGGTSTGLYRIDTGTGNATLLAPLPVGTDLRGAEFASFALPFGQGCSAGNGVLRLRASGSLLPGHLVTMHSDNHVPGTLRGIALGFARDRFQGQPLPLLLDPLLGTPDAFDARIQDARGQDGQRESAALLRAVLAGSALRESHREGDPRVQDAYALRCMPQVFGPALDAWHFAAGLVSRELNAATDNPLVLESGELLSGGNFHGQAVAMAADVLAIASANLAVMSERRTDRLVHPDFNHGLPAFLAQQPGLESGLMMAQVTAAALASDLKRLASPASVDSVPTDGNKEDVVPMAMGAALKLRDSVQGLRHVLAVELHCASVALDLRRPLTSSPVIERAHAAVRALVPPLAGDRPPSPDLMRLAEALAAGAFDPAPSLEVIA